MEPIYIGIAGQMRAGKDTVADYIFDVLSNDESFKLSFARSAFAKNVKNIFCKTFDVDNAFVEKWKTIPEPPPGFDMTVREALQFIGDGFRKIKSNIWIDLMFRNNLESKIISDVRYINEATSIVEKKGINFLIAHPDRLNNDQNGSEAQIRPYAKWCLDNMAVSGFPSEWIGNDKPENMDLFYYFIRNDKTMESLFENIDKEVIPLIKQYVKSLEDNLCQY